MVRVEKYHSEVSEVITQKCGAVTYEWRGGFGSVIQSYENGVTIGTVRYVCGQLVYAYIVEAHRFGPDRISWSIPDVDATKLTVYKARFSAGDY